MNEVLPRSPAQVTVVHAPACHFCEDAEAQLAGLAQRFAMEVRRVELDSPEGRDLVARHRPAAVQLQLIANCGRRTLPQLVRVDRLSCTAAPRLFSTIAFPAVAGTPLPLRWFRICQRLSQSQ